MDDQQHQQDSAQRITGADLAHVGLLRRHVRAVQGITVDPQLGWTTVHLGELDVRLRYHRPRTMGLPWRLNINCVHTPTGKLAVIATEQEIPSVNSYLDPDVLTRALDCFQQWTEAIGRRPAGRRSTAGAAR